MNKIFVSYKLGVIRINVSHFRHVIATDTVFPADFPSAKILVHHKNVEYGSTIKIMSEVVSNPRAEKFEWQKRLDGNLFVCIDIAKPNYFGSNLVHDTPVLVIPKATFDDKGHYRLAIWNKFGENVSNIIELKITGSMFLVI